MRDRPLEWCPRCGGPIAEAICPNCSTVEQRKREAEERRRTQRRELCRWVETTAPVLPDQHALAVLLRALLTGAAELRVRHDVVQRFVDGEQQALALPRFASIELHAFLAYCAETALHRNPSGKRRIITTFLAPVLYGRRVRWPAEEFLVERIADGFRVQLASQP